MNVDALRAADRFLGLPLCRLLTLVRRAACLCGLSSRSVPPRKVLFIKLSEMGSSVFLWPALSVLREHVPDLELFFLVFGENSDVLEELSFAPSENVVRVETGSPWRVVISGIRALRRLRASNIDTTIDFDFFSRFSAAIAFLVCRGNRVGFHRFTDEGLSRGRLLTHEVLYSPHIHTASAFLALVRSLFAPFSGDLRHKGSVVGDVLALPPYTPDPVALSAVKRKLGDFGADLDTAGTSLVLVNPNSSNIFPLRRWPADRYTEYCRLLLRERADVWIAVTGSPSERKEAEAMVRAVDSDRCISMAGQTTFPELMALYSVARLMVTNDSGPAHFSSVLKLPTIVLFGPETPRLYAPLGDVTVCLYAQFACSPCVSVYNAKKSPCRDNLCLQAISLEEVLKETRGLLRGCGS